MAELASLKVSEHEMGMLKDFFCRFLPGCAVWAYGSRINGTSTAFSDLDLVVFCQQSDRLKLMGLREALAESSIPFRVDLFGWHEIPESFQQQINGHHLVLFPPDETS